MPVEWGPRSFVTRTVCPRIVYIASSPKEKLNKSGHSSAKATTTILGGTREANNWSEGVDPATTDKILEFSSIDEGDATTWLPGVV